MTKCDKWLQKCAVLPLEKKMPSNNMNSWVPLGNISLELSDSLEQMLPHITSLVRFFHFFSYVVLVLPSIYVYCSHAWPWEQARGPPQKLQKCNISKQICICCLQTVCSSITETSCLQISILINLDITSFFIMCGILELLLLALVG